MKKALPFILPFLIILGLVYFYIQSGKPEKIYKKLPILGNHKLDTVLTNKGNRIDTIWHTIPDFNFVNQDNIHVNRKIISEKVFVVDYFFSTCQSICPIMSNQLERVYAANKDVVILSHTVDPETDTPQQLKKYAHEHHADGKRWMFLTGSKEKLYEQARLGYLLDAHEGNGGPEDFIHTQNFALIDKRGRIRGYYDGTDSASVTDLITDINFLQEEK